MSNKGKATLSIIGFVGSLIWVITSIMLAEKGILNELFAVVFTIIPIILLVVAIFSLSKIDYETGVYTCKNCGHTFKPTIKEYVLGAHTPTTRYLRCPECSKLTWCKRSFVEKRQ